MEEEDGLIGQAKLFAGARNDRGRDGLLRRPDKSGLLAMTANNKEAPDY
jgi:hypothetical protein